MLIRNAELFARLVTDLRIDAGRVSAIAAGLRPRPGERVIEANGVALLPGLHDHHLHLNSLAAALESALCGPPRVSTAEDLVESLQNKARAPRTTAPWIRGIGYHESVAGVINRDWLDRVIPDLPVRIQHRSGRLWILNTCALECLCPNGSGLNDSVLEQIDGRPSGRLFDGDSWLRDKLGGSFYSLRNASALLASFGVTGVTDTTPHNRLEHYRHFDAEKKKGALLQDVLAMGDASLDLVEDCPGVMRGALKIHLREVALPPFDTLCSDIRRSHAAARAVAIHCVTLAELVFAASALAECGARADDRIEHAALAPPETLPLLADLGITIVSQPNFISERGDTYLADVENDDLPWLYRARGFIDAGIRLAGSTDAPLGDPNPWLAMDAAVRRRSRAGASLGVDESLSPEAALALFTGELRSPGGPPCGIDVGSRADFCLLDRPWARARQDLAAVRVGITIKDGNCIWPLPSADSAQE